MAIVPGSGMTADSSTLISPLSVASWPAPPKRPNRPGFAASPSTIR